MEGHQLKLFRDITLDYFAKLSPDVPPTLEPPYLQFGSPPLFDYASLVPISGAYEGSIYLTSSMPALYQLLKAHGEPEVSERTLSDMCRELANVLAGNASHAFGDRWRIAVPRSLGPEDLKSLRLPVSSYVMPLAWYGATSLLVIGLEPTAEAWARTWQADSADGAEVRS